MPVRLLQKLVCGLRYHHWGDLYFGPVKHKAVILRKCGYCGEIDEFKIPGDNTHAIFEPDPVKKAKAHRGE